MFNILIQISLLPLFAFVMSASCGYRPYAGFRGIGAGWVRGIRGGGGAVVVVAAPTL